MLLLMFDLGHMADPLTKYLLHFFLKNKMSVIHGEKAVLGVVDTLHLCIEYISTLHNIDNACNLFGMEKKLWHNDFVID